MHFILLVQITEIGKRSLHTYEPDLTRKKSRPVEKFTINIEALKQNRQQQMAISVPRKLLSF